VREAVSLAMARAIAEANDTVQTAAFGGHVEIDIFQNIAAKMMRKVAEVEAGALPTQGPPVEDSSCPSPLRFRLPIGEDV